MNNSNTCELPCLDTLAFNTVNTATPHFFGSEVTRTTADYLLRIAAKRRLVRAIQAIKRHG